jgi:hypothetical protein
MNGLGTPEFIYKFQARSTHFSHHCPKVAFDSLIPHTSSTRACRLRRDGG